MLSTKENKKIITSNVSYLLSDDTVITFVNTLIQTAIDKNASDIHIEPGKEVTRIRFRCDGLLSEAGSISYELYTRIATRLKIMAQLNIAERRIPQDGRIQFHHHNKIDIRINCCPTIYGEKIVLRIFTTPAHLLDINNLGMTSNQENIFRERLLSPQGLILVTGPTGSGKTLTLYSALHYLNQIENNICTVEDPVEIELPGITQVNINAAIGLDFANILRAFLRQDPDIIMIGEIRDQETAAIAIKAAQTGHLVLATLHTNNAIEAITRLETLGIAKNNIATISTLILAQRLMRKLCHHCAQNGCVECNEGYHGRIGIFEIISNLNEEYMSLWEAGLEKIKNGVTNYAELVRVLGNKHLYETH